MKRMMAWVAYTVVLLVAGTALGRVAIMPTPEPPAPSGWVKVWVPPVYETIYERLWVPERTEMRSERVWVPPELGWCDGVYVEIKPGYWSVVYREVTIPAHFETVARRVLVRSGYWKWVRVEPPMPRPIPVPLPEPILRDPPTVGVEGYAPGNVAEDLSKFSPLSEWPK